MLRAPKTSIEKYNYYLACLRSLIDHERAIGLEMNRDNQ